jgi:putative transposase
MLVVAEQQFIQSLVRRYGKQNISTQIWWCTWYPQACEFLKLEHHLHSSYGKSTIERTIQYVKDRTECFDDYYFPCRKERCKLEHAIMKWLLLFVDMYNKEVIEKVKTAK